MESVASRTPPGVTPETSCARRKLGAGTARGGWHIVDAANKRDDTSAVRYAPAMALRASMHLTGRDAHELSENARRAEDAGIELLFASELYTNPFVQLAAAAAATKNATLATGVALAFVRSPLALALAAMDMDSMTGGRFVLGLGTGVKKLNERWHGVTNFGGPVRHMRERIAFIRQFVARAHTNEPITFEGEFIDVDIQGYRRPGTAARDRIPIYLGANKPLMLRLAGEVADGVLGHVFLSPKTLRERFLPAIAEGLAKSGREREALTIGAGIT